MSMHEIVEGGDGDLYVMQGISHQQKMFALHVGNLIRHIFEQKYTCTLGEAYRTAEQAAWYAKKGTGIKDSQHCKRLAIDLCIFDPLGKYLEKTEDYEPFGIFWEKLHPSHRWGGRFHKPDGNHFERIELK